MSRAAKVATRGVVCLALVGVVAAATGSAGATGAATYTGPETKFKHTYPTPAKTTGTRFTIGFLNPNGSIESLNAMQQAAARQVKLLGGSFIAKDSQLNPDRELSNFNQLLAQKVSAVITYPVDPRALAPALKAAAKAGVPVIGIDVNSDPTAPPAAGFTTQITLGRDLAAYSLAQEMAKLNPGGSIGEINIGAPVPAFGYQTSRLTYWSKRDGLSVAGLQLNATDTATGAATAATGLLGKYPKMSGLYAYNDLTGLSAAGTARAAGRKIMTMSVNGEPAAIAAVKSGRMAATFSINWVETGSESVIAAYDVLTKQGTPLPKLLTGQGHLVTPQNAGAQKSWSSQIAALRAGKA